MKLEQQVCSLELSKRLKELGVRQESLFYWVITLTTEYHLSQYDGVLPNGLKERNDCYSAFTVAELGEMLPGGLPAYQDVDGTVLNISKTIKKEWLCGYSCHDSLEPWRLNWAGYETADTEADARAKMLIYLLENSLIKL